MGFPDGNPGQAVSQKKESEMEDRKIPGGEAAVTVERVKALTDAFNEHDVPIYPG